VRTTRRTTIAVLAAALGLIAALPPSVTGDAAIENTYEVVGIQAAPAPPAADEDDPGPALAFAAVGRTDVSVPAGSAIVTHDILGDTSYLDPTTVPGLEASAPYFAWATVENTHPAVALHTGFANHGYFYGHVPAGGQVHDGDHADFFVAHKGQYPLFPPRAEAEVRPGGELVWEDLTPIVELIETRSVQDGQEVINVSYAGAAAANLRVDGGDLVATADVTSARLEVPLAPAGELCGSIALIQSGIPGVDVHIDLGGDVVDGQWVSWFAATVHPGSTWLESSDDSPGGTWKLRINVFWSCSAWGAEPTVAPPAPGDVGAVASWLGAHGIDMAVDDRAGLGATPTALALAPGSAPATTTVASSARATDEVGAFVATAVDAGCAPGSTSHRNAGIGDLLAPSTIALRADRGTVDPLCVNGREVARFGFPAVEVDGVVYEPDFFAGGMQAYEEPIALPQGPRLIYRLSALGRAGPVAFHAGYLVIVDPGEVRVLASLYDHHATDGVSHELRFPWYVDPEAGDGERFAVHGQAPLPVEAFVATATDPAGLGIGAHTVTAPDASVEHAIGAREGALVLVYDAARGPAEAAALGIVDLVPPRTLEGRSVAVLVPQTSEAVRGGDIWTVFDHVITVPAP